MNLTTYQELYDAYYCTGQYGPGDNSGLIQHWREMQEEYDKRRKLAAFPRFLPLDVRDNTVRPIFRNTPERSFKNDIVQVFLDNIDGAKADPVDINLKMPRILEMAVLYGVNFVLLDNHADADQYLRSELVDARKLPYVVMITPKQMPVNGLTLDSAGRIQRFCWIDSKLINGKKTKILKVYTAEFYEEYKFTGTKVPDKLNPRMRIEQKANALEEVPVFPLITVDQDLTETLPESPYNYALQILKLIYNYTSWIASNSADTAFPIFYGPTSMMNASRRDDGTEAMTLEIGSTRGLAIDDNSSIKPGYAAPPSAPTESMQKEREYLIELLLLHYSITWWQTGSNQSGESKKQDRWSRWSMLEYLAHRCENLERWLVKTMGKYMGDEYEYTVAYDTYYADDDAPEMIIDLALSALTAELNLAPEVASSIRNKVVKTISSEEPLEIQKALLEAQKRYNALLESGDGTNPESGNG